MELPANFESPPGQKPHRTFRNTCIEFKKLILNSKDINELKQEMQNFIEEAKQMDWQRKNTGVYHKDEGTKIVNKVFVEFKRYMGDLEPLLNKADPHGLLSALEAMEMFINDYKVL
jgi:hypothetical protein